MTVGWLKRWLTLAMALAAAGCTGADAPAPRLSADITFRALWWSPAQMEGLNPNAPPPKTTDVVLRKWEYSDPIGVPHPDVVNAVVQVRNEGEATLADVGVSISGQWQTGPLGAQREAGWTAPVVLRTLPVGSMAPGASVTAKLPIEVGHKIKELEVSRAWPWAFRLLLSVTRGADAKPLVQREAELPIRPGD